MVTTNATGLLHQLSRSFKRLKSSYYLDDCFLITSAGCAATRWIAASLNMHPDIACSGGAGELSDIMDYDRKPSDEETERIADFLINHFATPGGKPKTLKSTFDELRRFKPAKLYGNIHLFTVTSLIDHQIHEVLPKDFPLANVVRHPVGRLETHFGVAQKNYNTGPQCRRLLELCWSGFDVRFAHIKHELISLYPDLETDIRKRLFLYSLFDTYTTSLGDFINSDLYFFKHFKMEDLKQSPVVFSDLISYSTRGKIQANSSYLDRVFSAENLQRGRFTNRSTGGAAEVWSQWTDWQRAFFETADFDGKLTQPYRDLGYDFSFLQRGRA